jgi:hypothetical protein
MCESGCVTLTVQSLVILFVFVLSALFLLIGLTALLLATLILLLPRMAALLAGLSALLAGLSALLAIAIHFVCHKKSSCGTHLAHPAILKRLAVT